MHTSVPPGHSGSPGAPVTRLVYLPTNRPFEAAFRSVAAEVEAVRSTSHDDIRLLVVDDGSPEISRRNRELAGRVGREQGRAVHVLGPERWHHLVDEIVTAAALPPADADTARSALIKPTGSYGAGPNKAALFAAFVGARTLHRRDSDQITQVDPGSGRCPLHLEIELLDSAAGEAGAYCAGSSLTGEPTRDRRDLQHDSPDFARRIDALSKLSPETVRAPQTEGAPAPRRAVAGGGVPVERDLTGAVEMGIAALRTVHAWIPEMPAVGILGSDYFQKGLLYQLELPVYYHRLRARHVYEEWRAAQHDPRHLGRYALAELRYTILRFHWNAFNEALKAERGNLLLADGGFDSAAYGELFVQALARGERRAARLPHEFTAIYKEAAATASGEVRKRLEIRVAALEEAVDAAPGYVAEAIREFARLTRLWPTLMSAAARLGRRHGHDPRT